MRTIHIDASKSYDIIIGSGLLKDAGKMIEEAVGNTSAIIVSDDNVYPLYGEIMKQSLEAQGRKVYSFVFPHGEQSKTLATYGELLEYMCSVHLTRKDIVVALGGGVVGDLAGFAAATYQRGIRFVQVPTTLLACVDSSVGGKTAVDLSIGKNQVGAFCQPSLVICDIDTLNTLPEEEYKCGCAEVIKYGVLYSADFFKSLQATPVKDQYEEVIGVCVGMKRDVVQKDEFDTGERMFLNLGHTFGHAAEACANFSILHGQGVAMGMAAMARSAAAQGICSQETLKDLIDILKQYGLPTETPYPLEDMQAAALSDKKLLGGTLRLVVPECIGKCRIETIPALSVGEWMAKGEIK